MGLGIFDRDKSDNLRILELGDSIFIAEETKTPMSRLLPRGGKPKQMLATWPVQAYPRRAFGGTLDGTDLASFNHTNRDSIEAYAMWMMTEGWLVSRLAKLTKTAGVNDEEAKQAADDALILAQMIERQLCSDMDTQKEAGQSPYQSRGIFSWLATTPQTNLPVDASYRPSSACVYTSALASLTEVAFEAMLSAAATQVRQPVDLTGFVGIQLKRQMSLWAARDTTAGATDKALVSYNMNIESKKFMQIVDFFAFDAGKVKTVPSWYNLCDATTGEDSAYTPRSGAFVNLDMWELCWLDAPASYVEPRKSGGPRGYHDAVYLLKCKNPLGQVMVKTNS